MVLYKRMKDFSKRIQDLIEEVVYEDIAEKGLGVEVQDEKEEYSEAIFSNYVINYIYSFFYDEDEEDYIDEVKITEIEEYDIEALLKSKNIAYEKSKASESIYLDEGNFRLSTHKRPGYELHGSYTRHDYEKEYLFDNEIEMYLWVEQNL